MRKLLVTGIAVTFAGLCLLCALLTRKRDETQLAWLIASVAAGVQLWKTHAAGSYVEWYYPFVLIGLFCGGGPETEPEPVTSPEDPSAAAGRVA